MPPIVCFVGKSGSGKTTVIEGVVKELKRRSLRVGVIKHDAHDFDMDKPGKDTWRFQQAGADAVIISSTRKVALIERVQEEWRLDEVVGLLNGRVDLVITEGYRRDAKPKVEVSRAATGQPLLCADHELWAVVADWDVPTSVPRFGFEEVGGLVELVLVRTGLTGQQGRGGPQVSDA